jgi:hypothetical protein
MPKPEDDVLRKVNSIIIYANFGCIDRFFLVKGQTSDATVDGEDFISF